jgi:hypothetical protein
MTSKFERDKVYKTRGGAEARVDLRRCAGAAANRGPYDRAAPVLLVVKARKP